MAMAWAGFRENDEILKGTYDMMMAKSTKEVVEALKYYGSAGEGIVFARLKATLDLRQ